MTLVDVLVDRPEQSLSGTPLAQLVLEPNVDVVSSAHVLADEHELVSLNVPASQAWQVKVDVLEDGNIRLKLGVSYQPPESAAPPRLETEIVVKPERVAVVPTDWPARPQHALKLLVHPHVIRSQDDLRSVLESKMKGRESLSETQPKPSATNGPSPSPFDLGAKIKRLSPTEMDVDRSVVEKIVSPDELQARRVRTIPELEDGKQLGIRLFGIRPGSVLEAVGLENGDRVDSVNGHSLASPAEVVDVYAKLKTATQVDVVVNRKGKAMTLRYNIK